MKKCCKCKISKDLGDFNRSGKSKDGYQAHCRQCAKEYYISNKGNHIKNVANRNKLTKDATYKWVNDYKSTHPCVDCGENDPIVLEFDHIDRSTKIMSIALMIAGGYSLGKIQQEISKCEIRCANCHRRRTAKQRGWRAVI